MKDRTVKVGVGIRRAAQRAGLFRDLPSRTHGCAIEEHVFDHVRNAGKMVRLVEVPDLDMGGDAGQRNRGVLPGDNGQSVLENDSGRGSGIFPGDKGALDFTADDDESVWVGKPDRQFGNQQSRLQREGKKKKHADILQGGTRTRLARHSHGFSSR